MRLLKLFSKVKPLGRHSVRDSNPVFAGIVTNIQPALLVGGGQAQVAAILDSVAGGLSTTGTTQSGATPITAVMNEFTTVGSSGGASLLPVSKAGMLLYVDNAAGGNSMEVFPATGEKINGGSANAGFAVANAKRCIFYCVVAGNWKTILTA
jgi:hypothetical protein